MLQWPGLNPVSQLSALVQVRCEEPFPLFLHSRETCTSVDPTKLKEKIVMILTLMTIKSNADTSFVPGVSFTYRQ